MRGATSVLLVAAGATLAFPAGSSAQLLPPSTGTCEFMAALSSFNPDANSCLGTYSGNDSKYIEAIKNTIEARWGFTDAQYLGKTEADGNDTDGPFGDVPTGGAGWLSLDVPLTGDYVLVLKSANNFSLYLFQDLVDVDRIYYTTVGITNQGLSHVSLYGDRTVSVPEPESAALLLTGLIALGYVSARRRREDLV